MVLFDDIFRHIVFLCQPNTALVGRFGLTAKYWYPAVWKHQHALNVPSVAAAVSLSKRKAIDVSIIREITLDFPIETWHDIDAVRDTFVKRFVASDQAKSLRKLRIRQQHAWSILMIPTHPDSFPASLEDFEYIISPKRSETPSVTPILESIPLAPCAAGLKRLFIETHADINRSVDHADPLAIAKACPNLEEFGILWHPRTGGHLFGPALKQIKQHLPKVKRIIVPSWIPCLSTDFFRQAFRVVNGTIPLPVSQLLDRGKIWLQNVIQDVGIDVARVLCTRAASVFELALQWAYSIEMFSHCCDLGLPLSLLGQNSAVACLLAGPFPTVCNGFFHLMEPVPAKKLFDFVKLFFRKHGDEVDFHATTIRLPSEDSEGTIQHMWRPRKQTRVNLMQAALISGSFEILTFITSQVKEFFYDRFTPQDLMYFCYGERINPVWLTLYNVADDHKIVECLRNLHAHPEFTKQFKLLMNEPDPEDEHKFPAILALEEHPDLLGLVATTSMWQRENNVFFDLSPPDCRDAIKRILERKGWSAAGEPNRVEKHHQPWFQLHMRYMWSYVNKPQ